MKKAGLFVIALLVISLIPHVLAQDEVPGLGDNSLVDNVQKLQGVADEDTRTEYLKQQWGELLVKAKFIGPIIKVLDAFMTAMSPFFKIVLGVPYTMSWLFIFALLIWIGLFFLLKPISSELTGKGIYGAGISFAIVSLIGLSGVIKQAADLLSTIITQTWMLWLAFFLAIIYVLIFDKIGKAIKAKIKKSKENEAKEQTKQDQEIIHKDADIAKKELDSFKK